MTDKKRRKQTRVHDKSEVTDDSKMQENREIQWRMITVD